MKDALQTFAVGVVNDNQKNCFCEIAHDLQQKVAEL